MIRGPRNKSEELNLTLSQSAETTTPLEPRTPDWICIYIFLSLSLVRFLLPGNRYLERRRRPQSMITGTDASRRRIDLAALVTVLVGLSLPGELELEELDLANSSEP